MEKVANRLYALAEQDKLPESLRKELNIWLEKMQETPGKNK
ncbi:MAG: hypothetical protein PF795_11735 [Kiritimatiellae bacterium]|jgi:hypothetical protein|nr:hypothetical protein [Kiritimatiellia bacterium]